MLKPGACTKLAACLLVVAVGVVAYLPAVDNFFISDDFTLLAVLKNVDERPLYLLEMPSELFRVMSYLYFWVCFRVFGATDPQPYYWSGIALHVLVSLLVMALVLRITGQWLAAWAAGLFFAGYERHQEAVMWISAVNDTILTFNCLMFLLFWRRYLSHKIQTAARTLSLTTALAALGLALFSKEGAVALAPLAVFGLVVNGSSGREALRKCLPLLVMTVAWGGLWLSQADRNFFVTEGFYALSPQFFPVYARSLMRLLSPLLVFLVPLVLLSYRTNPASKLTRVRLWISELAKDPSFLFFAALLALAPVPYSFLTYLNHIPSRNTYFPSVGLAGIVGMLFMVLYKRMDSEWGKRASIAFLLIVVSLNVTYIWTKKEPQFRARAAPTRQLIAMLNDSELDIEHHSPITVCGFPLDPWIGKETVAGFTRLKATDVVFAKDCDDSIADVLRWDNNSESYTGNIRAESAHVND